MARPYARAAPSPGLSIISDLFHCLEIVFPYGPFDLSIRHPEAFADNFKFFLGDLLASIIGNGSFESLSSHH